MGCRIQDPATCGKHQTTKKIPGVPARGEGCRIQDPGIRGYQGWKTADFLHSAGTAHGVPPYNIHGRSIKADEVPCRTLSVRVNHSVSIAVEGGFP